MKTYPFSSTGAALATSATERPRPFESDGLAPVAPAPDFLDFFFEVFFVEVDSVFFRPVFFFVFVFVFLDVIFLPAGDFAATFFFDFFFAVGFFLLFFTADFLREVFFFAARFLEGDFLFRADGLAADFFFVFFFDAEVFVRRADFFPAVFFFVFLRAAGFLRAADFFPDRDEVTFLEVFPVDLVFRLLLATFEVLFRCPAPLIRPPETPSPPRGIR